MVVALAHTLQLRKTRLEWVARRLALSGCLSRREAVAAIEEGAVQVDGRVLTRDIQVCDEAVIFFRGRQMPSIGSLPALYGMIKPPRVACKYTSDSRGPTLKTLLAELAATKEKQRTQHSKQRRDHVECGRWGRPRDRAAEWAERAARFECGRHSDCPPSTGLRDRHEDFGVHLNDMEKAAVRNRNSTADLCAPGHLIPVNILPLHAEGLVVLTNDGGFAHALRDPANKLITAYDIRVSGPLPSVDLWRQWALGVRLAGIDYGRVWVELLRPCPSGAWLRVKLVEPPGADIRFLLGSCGLKVRRVRLYAFGPYLSSSVPPGRLLPLQLDRALMPLAPQQRRRLMLVPAEGELNQVLQAAGHLKSAKGGGFAAARFLKENSALVKLRCIKER